MNLNEKISIIYDQIRWEEKRIYQEAKDRKVNIQLIDAKEINFKTDTSKEELKEIYFFFNITILIFNPK